MSRAGKLGHEFEMNVAAEKFYQMFKKGCNNLPNISPKAIQDVKLHEGDWDNHGHGSTKIWNYMAGKPEVFKERVEFDDEKLKLTKIGLEGDVFNQYRVMNLSYQVVPKGPEKCLAILNIQYEKLNDDIPYPYKYLNVMTQLTKDIESHLKSKSDIL